jgi:hypothetical protein
MTVGYRACRNIVASGGEDKQLIRKRPRRGARRNEAAISSVPEP